MSPSAVVRTLSSTSSHSRRAPGQDEDSYSDEDLSDAVSGVGGTPSTSIQRSSTARSPPSATGPALGSKRAMAAAGNAGPPLSSSAAYNSRYTGTRGYHGAARARDFGEDDVEFRVFGLGESHSEDEDDDEFEGEDFEEEYTDEKGKKTSSGGGKGTADDDDGDDDDGDDSSQPGGAGGVSGRHPAHHHHHHHSARRRALKLPQLSAAFDISAGRTSPGVNGIGTTGPARVNGDPHSRPANEVGDAIAEEEGEDDAAETASSVSSLGPEERNRFEWQDMLGHVIRGEVLGAEKKRLRDTTSTSKRHDRDQMYQVWVGLRAYLRLRTVPEEKRYLEDARLQMDAVFEDVRNFSLEPGTDGDEAMQKVGGLLQRVDWCEELFPSSRALLVERPQWAEAAVLEKLEVLRSWDNITQRLRMQIRILQKFTGSGTLDVSQPQVEPVLVQRVIPEHPTEGAQMILDSSTFVERLLQEGSVKRLFAKKTFEALENLITNAKATMIKCSSAFEALRLPAYTDDLIAVAAFPPSLMQEVLRVRLQNAKLLRNDLATVSPVLLAQLTDDFRTSLTHATAVKRSWMATMKQEPGWEMPQPEAARQAYDEMLANVLRFFFRLLDTNVMQGGNKSLDAKDTEIVEGEWGFLKTAVEEIAGGDVLLGEHYSTLTHRLMSRVQHFFDSNLATLEKRLASRTRNLAEIARWFEVILSSLRQRHRKVLRFARTILGRFENSAEYLLDRQAIDLLLFVNGLVETNHFLIYTGTFEKEGIYLVGGPSLMQRPDLVADLLLKCFHLETQPDYEPPKRTAANRDEDSELNNGGEYSDYPHYILILSPRDPFMWTGQVMNLDLPKVDLDVRDHRVRLVAQGPGPVLGLAKAVFLGIFPAFRAQTVVDQKAHLQRVNKEIKKVKRASYRMSERVINSVDQVIAACKDVPNSETLLIAYFYFAAELSERSIRYMEKAIRERYLALLIQFGIKWISFVSDDCKTDDPKTFRAAVLSLEFIMEKTKGDNILLLSDDQFARLRSKVASCMTLLISHFDVLGARTRAEQKQQKEKQEAARQEMRWRLDSKLAHLQRDAYQVNGSKHGSSSAYSSLRDIRDRWDSHLAALEQARQEKQFSLGFAGNELDHATAEDIGLSQLASSTSNISIRWQQGKFVGGGTFGSVYIALNLESGDIMAVKEIRLQDPATAKPLVEQIRSEMQIMSLLRHEHIVEYYGIEVHRDKVYIFEEFCEGGSLTSVLEHGRIEEEIMCQVYTQQLLLGLAYLHERNIVHRDIKPDNILLDRQGRLKYVDFGAAKMLNQSKTLAARTRAFRTNKPAMGAPPPVAQAGEMTNATGTPMYMSPETIKGGDPGRRGAMDIWSLGCVCLQMVTGRKPWSNLDNDWAIMFHIGIATKHPPLPDPSELSEIGIDFLRTMLNLDPYQRATALECLQHPWMLDVAAQLRAMGGEDEDQPDQVWDQSGGNLGALAEEQEPEAEPEISPTEAAVQESALVP